MESSNYKKHTSKNPLKRILIGNYFKTITNLLGDLKIDSVLDVGCGEGFALHKLKEQKIGKILEGIDSSDLALKLGNKLYPDLSLKKGDIYNLHYKDKAFDLVMVVEVLEHLEKPAEALAELMRISKKYLLLSVPNVPLFQLFNYTQWGKDIGHINHWTFWEFEKFIQKNGKGKLRFIAKKHPFPWTILLLKLSYS